MANTLPVTQRAIVANAVGDLIIAHDVPLPELKPDLMLIRTVAVAINPADIKMTGAMAAVGCTAGGDCAGIVLAIGTDVPAGRFAIGDRVCAPNIFMNPVAPRDGAFQEFVGVTADFALKVPDHMLLEEAAALGIGLITIGYALFRSLDIPGHPEMPAEEPGTFVLVYGGSSASGTLAIQLIRRAGCIPITTCSPKNFPLVKACGAQEAWDYHDPDCAEKIKAYTEDELGFALDCFCRGSSMEFCYKALGRAGGRYTTLEPYPAHLHKRKRVKPDWLLGPALVGREVAWKDPYHIKPKPELRSFGKQWFLTAQRMLDRGEVRPHPIRIGEKFGLEGVLEGIEILRQGALSGEKLVYRIGEAISPL
ncbi:putative zinc-binding dehydrogenase family [Rosellinia necatrix]|uniref:Putative zinc-binding dehydrogenase family n=1 Tax=Rosellinia necatrix TaxID=77044 RepID=A0A1S7UKF3_ROSNE|nr:putative zinc-binding dehydrogenase family [Rosellinia necatrix]